MNHVESPITFNSEAALLFGRLVETAYSMFETGTATPNPPQTFPGGYKFVAWVQMQDFAVFGAGPYAFYGLIAQDPTHAAKYVLAIRGTENLIEFIDDLTSILPVPFSNLGGAVGNGFYNIYRTLRVVYPIRGDNLGSESLEAEGSFARQVAAALRLHSGHSQKQIIVTGHSLGAALATLYVADPAHDAAISIPLICTFASPLVGDAAFAAKFAELGCASWRIANDPDLVTKLPPPPVFKHVQVEHLYNSSSSTALTQSCFHDLKTYLHLLDPSQSLAKQCLRLPRGARRVASDRDEIRLLAPAGARPCVNITIKIG